MSGVDMDRLRADVGDALSGAISRHERSMLTRWVVLAETMEADGTRGVWCLAPDGAKPWDTIGMVEYARDLERAAAIADRLDPDE